MLGLTLDILRAKAFGIAGGGGGSLSYTPPLDTYSGATAAYSVRKLSSSYSGPCIEAYRVSDGATQDIGFDGDGLIDTAAIATFGGSSEVTVKTWYDQTSSGADLTKTDTANLPTIYDGASIIEVNGNPAVRIVRVANAGPGEWLQTSSAFVASTAGQMEFFAVFPGSGSGSGGDRFFWDSNAGPTTSGIRWGSFKRSATFYFQNILYATGDLNQQLVSAGADATTNYIFYNGSQVASGASSGLIRTDPYTATLGAREGGNEGYNTFDIQELIHYPAFQGTNRSGINANLNSYYQIANLPATSSGLLYDYPGAAAAYSVRSLSNNAVKCMRVRRTVPPYDELDIGFDSNGDLDTAAIATFGGSDSLRVSRWYDQSGFFLHAVQNTPGEQPQIYNGTAVITENGKPAIDFTNNHFFSVPSSQWTDGNMMSSIVLRRRSGNDTYWTSSGAVFRLFYENIQHGFIHYGTTPNSTAKGSAPALGQILTTSRFGGGSVDLYENGSSVASTPTVTGSMSTASDTAFIGQRSNGGNRFDGPMQELIHWSSDQSSNRAAIESNINAYYSIYTEYNPDAPTSGFLFDYSGASVAYSVRQLNDNATYAMRVRRTVSPFDEQDIGFDGSGNLDTSAISTFGGSDSLTVSRWYDQTGNQNHATPPSASSQGLIYDGVAVITEASLPAIDMDKSVSQKEFELTTAVPFTGDMSSYFVHIVKVDGNQNLWGNTTSSVLGQAYRKYSVTGTNSSYGAYAIPDRKLVTFDRSGGTYTVYRNGTSYFTKVDSASNSFFRISGNGANAGNMFQEIIFYGSGLSGNQSAIESNINTYYSIY